MVFFWQSYTFDGFFFTSLFFGGLSVLVFYLLRKFCILKKYAKNGYRLLGRTMIFYWQSTNKHTYLHTHKQDIFKDI